MADPRWLLLIHQIPPRPHYLRVKIGRRLQRLGAVAIKSSVYALPNTDDACEDFHWLVREIVEGKGDAWVASASFVEGLSDGQVEALFQDARAADYTALIEAARQLGVALGRGASGVGDLARLRKRLADVVSIDFFGANGREAAEALVAELEEKMETKHTKTEPPRQPFLAPGHTWVTRKGIKVDRIASAWLVQRFVDPEARFKFVPGQGYQPAPGELRFDMFEAEYTHEGDRCTFEVLLDRFAIDDPALRQIAEIVHDLDLKDGKFGRAEASGLERLIAGLVASHADDEARLLQGTPLFAQLYQSFREEEPARA